MPPSVSSQALDAGWSHILHQPIAVRALLTQEASIPPGAVGRSLAYSTEALAWPAYCRVSGKALPFPESRRAFLGATQSAVQQPGADVCVPGRAPATVQNTHSGIRGHHQP